MVRRFLDLGKPEGIRPYQIGPSRVQFQNKDRAVSRISAPASRGHRRSARPTR